MLHGKILDENLPKGRKEKLFCFLYVSYPYLPHSVHSSAVLQVLAHYIWDAEVSTERKFSYTENLEEETEPWNKVQPIKEILPVIFSIIKNLTELPNSWTIII